MINIILKRLVCDELSEKPRIIKNSINDSLPVEAMGVGFEKRFNFLECWILFSEYFFAQIKTKSIGMHDEKHIVNCAQILLEYNLFVV